MILIMAHIMNQRKANDRKSMMAQYVERRGRFYAGSILNRFCVCDTTTISNRIIPARSFPQDHTRWQHKVGMIEEQL